MLAKSAMASFLGSLKVAGIAVPPGISLMDRLARESSEAVPSAASQARLSADLAP